MNRFLQTIFLVIVFAAATQAQGLVVNLTGTTAVNPGTTYTYNVVWTYNGSPSSAPAGGTYSWSILGGTIHSSGAGYAAVTWTGSGTLIYSYTASGTTYNATLNASTSGCTGTPTPTFSLASSTCSPRQLSYTGAPPAGIIWYWQTSTTGTSTTNSTNTYSVTVTGTYYVRAYNTAGSCWSAASASYSVSVTTSTTPTPSTPIAGEALCGPRQLYQNGTPPTGVTWYWQGTNSSGTSTVNASAAYVASTSGTYYLRARDNTSGCWSTTSTFVNIVVNETPATPSTPSVTTDACSSKTLSKVGAPPSGVSWYWQGINNEGTDYTSATATAATFTATVSGTYYLNARGTNGCWSSSASVSVTVAPPATPASSSFTELATTSFRANWTAVGSIDDYKVELASSPYFESILSTLTATTNTLLVTGLTAGNTYYFRVRARKGCLYSPYTSVNTVVLLPAAPTANAATEITLTSFIINWTPVNGATAYYFDLSTSSSFSPVTTLVYDNENTSSSNGLSGNPNGAIVVYSNITTQTTNYYYRIRAVNSAGASANSDVITVTQTPGTPIAKEATNVSQTSFTASWDPVAAATEYRLDVSTSKTFETKLSGYDDRMVTVTSQSVGGLMEGGVYYYRVRAKNSSITSPNSNVIKTVTWKDHNYIATTDVAKAGLLTENQVSTAPVGAKIVRFDYLDGIGRPEQSVNWQASPLMKDIVQPKTYDGFGREAIKYLPYVATTADASYQQTALVNLLQFYSNGTSDKVEDDTPLSETRVESSILGRVIKQGAPGAAWQPDMANTFSSGDRTIKMHYAKNLASEVLLWKYTSGSMGLVNATTVGAPTTPVYYVAGELSKTMMKDEGQNLTIEYKDRTGKIILKRVQVVAGTPSTTDADKDTNYASTYYVYDNYNNLVCVIPPQATKLITQTSSEYFGTNDSNKEAFLKRWAFRYTYDNRNRISQKQVPGAEPVYMVYDKWDRLVLTQDGNQRAGATNAIKYWTFTKYDNLNRPIMTGIKDTTSTVQLTQATMQNVVDAFYSVATHPRAEVYVGNVANNIHGYSNNSYPETTSPGNIVDGNRFLTVTYYDNYSFALLWGARPYVNDTLQQVVNGYSYQMPAAPWTAVKGLATGSKVKVLDGGVTGGYVWLKSVMYYDRDYHLIQKQDDNFKGGVDRTSTLYDFAGKVLVTKIFHNIISWKDQLNVSTLQNKLIKTGAVTDWDNSGAASVQQIGANAAGWIEFVALESNTKTAIGLSDTNPNAHYTSIDFCILLNSDATFQVYESGIVSARYSGSYSIGDVFRIERSAGFIKYFRNNAQISISANASTSALIADVAFGTANGTAMDIRMYAESHKRLITRRIKYDHDARVTRLYHQVGTGLPVTWTNLTGVTFSAMVLTKTAAGGSWNAGAFSQQSIPANTNGWIEFRSTSNTKGGMVGLSDADGSVNYTGIDFAMYPAATGILYIFEGGVNKATLGAYTANDVFRIERQGQKILYKKNLDVVYTSTIASTSILYGDCSLHAAATAIDRAYIGTGEGSSMILLAENEYNEVGQMADKKLHKANGGIEKQSVDHRYNIRGWITSVNNAGLSNDGITNDDANDYFGMQLSYSKIDPDLNNDQLYNGNISAIKWSNYPGSGTVKQKGYRYRYDALNRITSSMYSEKATNWSNPANNGFDERGYTYDLNGNLIKLTRFDKKVTGFMDSLEYNYGDVLNTGNKLMKVTDYGNDFRGFVDGTNSDADYSYDANGNVLTDKNRQITANIVYNLLNLPEIVTKGGNTVTYVYDARGHKLAQLTGFGSGSLKQTDYADEFTYENEQLQFIDHEHGRIAMASQSLTYANSFDVTAGVNASGSPTPGIATLTANDGEKYVKLTAPTGVMAGTGAFPIGGTFIVSPGDRYRVRVKGYWSGNTARITVNLKINGSITTVFGPSLMDGPGSEAWVEQDIVIPPSGTEMEIGVLWNTVAVNDFINLNEMEVLKLSATTPEYQYNMKDHLGSVRLLFTTKDETEIALATMETANAATERAKFLYYDEAIKVNHPIWDHTNSGATTYAARLTGGSTNEIFGLARSLSVMPGDVVTMEVFAKYLDTNSSNWTMTLSNFIASITNGTAPAGTFVDGGGAGSLGGGTYPVTTINHSSETGAPPKAYLNYILFNRDFVVLNSGFRRVTTNAREYGQDAPHERLAFDGVDKLTITEPGYLFVYLSNENPTSVEVYFDDFKVTHIKSPVLQMNDYYAFGLAFNSFRRENSMSNQYLFNGMEEQEELNLGFLDYKARMYMPEIGRWGVNDPLAGLYYDISPYAYVANNPVNAYDIDGRKIIYVNGYFSRILNLIGQAPGAPREEYWNFFSETFLTSSREFMSVAANEASIFIDGSSYVGGDQSGGDRYERGRQYAMEHFEELIEGMADGETIKFVSHSEGGAFAAGMADYLSYRGFVIEGMLYLSPDEADEFTHPVGIFSIQSHFENDIISPSMRLEGVNVYMNFSTLNGEKVSKGGAHGATVSTSNVRKMMKILGKLGSSMMKLFGTSKWTVKETKHGYTFTRIEEEEEEDEEDDADDGCNCRR
jgi:RHS repeat-associated protein